MGDLDISTVWITIFRIAAAKWYPVGIQDGRILDGQLNSSSSLYYATAQTSRLEFPGYTIGSDQGGWRPRSNARTDWLGVDLMVQHEIGQLAVQGSGRNGYYVKQFELSYSNDDKKYVRYPKVIYYPTHSKIVTYSFQFFRNTSRWKSVYSIRELLIIFISLILSKAVNNSLVNIDVLLMVAQVLLSYLKLTHQYGMYKYANILESWRFRTIALYLRTPIMCTSTN